MSSRKLREKKIREEAIAKNRAERRLNQQLEAKIDSKLRIMPNMPREMAEKISTMQIALENKGANAMQPLRNLTDPQPDPPPQIIIKRKKKELTPEEFERWLALNF